MSNLKNKIFASNDIEAELVEVKQWDAIVEVRTLSGLQRSKLLQSSVNLETGKPDLEKIYPELIIASCYDPEDGEKIFSPGDRDELNTKSGAALEQLAKVAMRLAGLTGEEIKEAEKN